MRRSVHCALALLPSLCAVSSWAQPIPLPKLAVAGEVPEKLREGTAPDLLTAAGGYRPARVLAQIVLGGVDGALKDALAERREAQTKPQMVRALGDVARCLKARDLSLTRANQFLEFQRTGEGEDPIASLR